MKAIVQLVCLLVMSFSAIAGDFTDTLNEPAVVAPRFVWRDLEPHEKEGLKELFINYSDLFDPFSVQFRKVKIYKGNGNYALYCGQSNQKNRIGGYLGWRNFHVISAGDATNVRVFNPQSSSEKKSAIVAWHKACMASGVKYYERGTPHF